jgi:dolichol-phosphate mannosyltransferase
MKKSNETLFFRLVKFGIVGTSGVIVNQCVLVLATKYIDYRIGSLIAIETAIVSNFLLNYHWTWNDRKLEAIKDKTTAFIKFNLTSFTTAFLVNWTILVYLTEIVHVKYWTANLAGILVAAAINFCIGNFWVFKKY